MSNDTVDPALTVGVKQFVFMNREMFVYYLFKWWDWIYDLQLMRQMAVNTKLIKIYIKVSLSDTSSRL